MDTHLELLTSILIYERCTIHRVAFSSLTSSILAASVTWGFMALVASMHDSINLRSSNLAAIPTTQPLVSPRDPNATVSLSKTFNDSGILTATSWNFERNSEFESTTSVTDSKSHATENLFDANDALKAQNLLRASCRQDLF